MTLLAGDEIAEAVFLAGLPAGEKGDLIPGHTVWGDLGPKAKERYRSMAQAVVDNLAALGHFCTEDQCQNRAHYELRA